MPTVTWLNPLAALSSSMSFEASGPRPRIRMRETAGRLPRILNRSPARTTDPAIISSHIASWRPIGHDPAHGRLVRIDSPRIRETSDGARAHDRATLVMVCGIALRDNPAAFVTWLGGPVWPVKSNRGKSGGGISGI